MEVSVRENIFFGSLGMCGEDIDPKNRNKEVACMWTKQKKKKTPSIVLWNESPTYNTHLASFESDTRHALMASCLHNETIAARNLLFDPQSEIFP